MQEHDELRLLRALLRASDYGVLLSDATRRDLVCNRRFSEWFGLSEQETTQAPPEQVRAHVLPRLKDPEEFVGTLDAIYADPKLTREDEVELVAPRPRVLHRYTAPVLDEHGRVIGRLWTFADITRTRRLEKRVLAQQAQLKEQARQLAVALRAVHGRLGKVENALTQTQRQLFESEKLSAIGLLAASVAHDIRNILTPLTIELALADTDDPNARAQALDAMRAQLDRLALLTQRLLALSRPAPDQFAPVDVCGVVERIVALLTPQAVLESVTLTAHCARRLPHVHGDAVQMEQVLVNLALNAVQAMRATDGGALEIAACRRRGGVSLRVSDTGPGMDKAVRRRLFDPFFSTKPGGAGLGLFSCRRIVEAHGGALTVRSAPARGTAVQVWLPGEET
ncbi:MAG: PAS domain-containing protein [Armatimonadetes bacterium]|nr:PAS domain-containing protein [Armatimonadota bacterium]